MNNDINKTSLENSAINDFLNQDLSHFGLTTYEVTRRLKNQKQYKSINNDKNILSIICNNLFTCLNLLLLVIVIIILKMRRYDQLFFLIVNSLNIIISIVQEIKIKKTLDKINLILPNNIKVIRDGCVIEISNSNLVLGDCLVLGLGNQIVADVCVKHGILEVNESFLTGESKSVLKKTGDIVYSGSYVISGLAYADVISLGEDTYVSNLIKQAKKYQKIKTPLMKTFSMLVKLIFFATIPTTIILFCSYKFNFYHLNDEHLLGICGFMLGMTPSGLFLLMSMISILGFIRLFKRKAYMKDLLGIEMLSQINILCLDKTGTITDGNMNVKKILKYSADDTINVHSLMANFVQHFSIDNNPTQKALYNYFNDYFNSQIIYKVKNLQAFSSIRKYSAIEFEELGTFLLGAPEFLLKQTNEILEKDLKKYTNLGYRVLLLVHTNDLLFNIDNNTDYQVISLILLEDIIKKDAYETIKYFQNLGIKIKIISGDNAFTTGYIAQRIGLINSVKEKSLNLTNIESEKLCDLSNKYDVFGRATPEQKKTLISCFKNNNQKVAMIGDGVNDILAFKESDLSISMASGSKAAQNVANLILINSKFDSLPSVFLEGRRLINNLEKNSIVFLTKTIFTFLLAWITIINNFLSKNLIFFPFTPLQLNFIDICFIGIPSFFLSLESNYKPLNNFFISDVLKKSGIYGLLISFNYILILTLYAGKINSFRSHYQISYLLTLITAFIFASILFMNCFPFDKFKIILFFSIMFIFSLLLIIFVWKIPFIYEIASAIWDVILIKYFYFIILLVINLLILFRINK
ncbi:HAD-IC family P-type ATPase [Candidatus Phytoplasma citri]|uniref:HAD-IC family P-type ATPase n=1 Tax=Candidatus Phytoplasma citri TaxID=180978 RepID=A0ABU8ZQ70_9MOLU|nr:HAD-IC family P-type ATPase [Candidatus Phytoplasma aurantifolia]MDO8059914.1 HAD-IC family P-type ATPase [Candidatus Phytoplasma aurantifolia]